MKDFRDLQVWHKAHLLVLASYRSTGGFPRQEMYGMTSQIRGALLQSPPILRRVVVIEGTGNFNGTSTSLQGRPASWNTIFFWLAISTYWMKRPIGS